MSPLHARRRWHGCAIRCGGEGSSTGSPARCDATARGLGVLGVGAPELGLRRVGYQGHCIVVVMFIYCRVSVVLVGFFGSSLFRLFILLVLLLLDLDLLLLLSPPVPVPT